MSEVVEYGDGAPGYVLDLQARIAALEAIVAAMQDPVGS